MSDLIDRQAAIDTAKKCQVKEVTPAYMLIDKAEVMAELMMLPSAQPDNDMIHLQKEQAYLQGWEEGREALRKEVWEDGRDRLN